MKIRVTLTAEVYSGRLDSAPVETAITRSFEADEGDNPLFVSSVVVKLAVRAASVVSTMLRREYGQAEHARNESRSVIEAWLNRQ